MGFYVPTNKDVKFPKACENCYFYDGLLCCVLDTYIYDPENKHGECPLIEVPPHGDLIDREALTAAICSRLCIKDLTYLSPADKSIVDEINDAPVVVPASADGWWDKIYRNPGEEET